MFKNSKGFTLIELLTVIAIIGILASIVVVSVNTARMKSRDARRIADIGTIRTAMEMYADANNGSYPQTAIDPATGRCRTEQSISGLTPTYLPVLPRDPRTGASGYVYWYCSDGSEYKIQARIMESSEGQNRATNDGGTKNTCPNTNGQCAYELFSSGGRAYDYF